MFIVNDAAMGVARGGVMTDFNTEYTVQAHKKEVAAYCDWYHVAANKMDWGHFGLKLGLAYQAYIEGKVVKAMASIITANSAVGSVNTNRDGIAGYIANGFSDANFLTVARNVELANGGATVYALGTKLALANVLPASTDTQFRYTEDGQIVKTGMLPAYKGVSLVELGNALVPNTINGAPQVLVDDYTIYMLPMGMNRPVKVVMEGDSLTVTKDPLEMADHTYVMQINMMIGVDVVVGSKFGAIVLNH